MAKTGRMLTKSQARKAQTGLNIVNRLVVAGMVSQALQPRTRIDIIRDIFAYLSSVAGQIDIVVPEAISIVGYDSTKIRKSLVKALSLTGIVYLAPAIRGAQSETVCPHATWACFLLCLDQAGKNGLKSAINSRRWKTWLYFNRPDLFGALLYLDLLGIVRKAENLGVVPSARLDGTSDTGLSCFVSKAVRSGHLPGLEDLILYDYTVCNNRALIVKDHDVSLTMSFKGSNHRDCADFIQQRIDGDPRCGGVAVVYDRTDGAPFPEFDTIGGFEMPVINGDASDFRPADCEEFGIGQKEPFIVGLTVKKPMISPARKVKRYAMATDSGFFRSCNQVGEVGAV